MPIILRLFFGKIWSIISKIPIQYVLIGVAIIGAYWYGHHQGDLKYKAQLAKYAELQKKKQEVITKLQTVTDTKIVTQYKDRIHTVTVTKEVNSNQAASVVPSQNYLSQGWVYLHNQSVANLPGDPKESSNSNPSEIKDNVALETIVENYAACHANAEQLEALQNWIITTKKNIDEANKKVKK